MKQMTNNVTMRNTTEYEDIKFEHDLLPIIYTSLIITTVVFSLLQSISFFYFTSSASIVLHQKTFNNILMAKMDFFDTHLSGMILNRFSKDIAIVDEQIPFIYYEVIRVSDHLLYNRSFNLNYVLRR